MGRYSEEDAVLCDLTNKPVCISRFQFRKLTVLQNILMGAPDRKSENIILEGGTWSTAKQKAGTIIGAPFRFIGVKNLIMKDMTIKTNRKGHIIEVADMYGFTVEGCSISGNNLDSRDRKSVV